MCVCMGVCACVCSIVRCVEVRRQLCDVYLSSHLCVDSRGQMQLTRIEQQTPLLLSHLTSSVFNIGASCPVLEWLVLVFLVSSLNFSSAV